MLDQRDAENNFQKCFVHTLLGTQKSMDKIAEKRLNNEMYYL
jgi:hypothetical protein